MKKALLFAYPGDEVFCRGMAEHLGADIGEFKTRAFADGETWLQILSQVRDREIAIVCSLLDPNPKWLPLSFLAGTLKELGARQVGLVAPYLSYMRQDRAFHEGEAVSSRIFARQVSSFFDFLVTVDPHLHRYDSLGEIYSCRGLVVHAASVLSDWIKTNCQNALVIGPDEESEQWASQVAKGAGAPWLTLVKERRGDRDITVSVPNLEGHSGRTPILVDDILSTGTTMAKAALRLVEAGLPAPICLAVHGVFAEGAERTLQEAGVTQIVTCNTIPHATNGMDLSPLVAEALRGLLEGS